MAALTCELCNSTDFVKEGDYFVCQSCGMKYDLESAKAKMQIESTPAEAPAEAAPAASAVATEVASNEEKPFDMDAVRARTEAAIAAIDPALPVKEQISARNKIVAAATEDSIDPYSEFVYNAWQETKYELDNMSKSDRNGYKNFSLGFEHDTITMNALNALTTTLNEIIDEHIAFVVPAHLDVVDMEFFDVVKQAYRALADRITKTPFYRSDTSGFPTWKKECKPRIESFEKTWVAWTEEKMAAYFAIHPDERAEYTVLEQAVATEQAKVDKASKKARFFVRKEREKAAQSDELDAAKAAEEAFRRRAIEQVL